MHSILSSVGHFVITTISTLGYPGVALLMGIGAFNIPIPSEIIMPFSGYLASTGQFSLVLVTLVAAAGWLIGTHASYFLGLYGGRPLIAKYGKYILVSEEDIARGERWFARFGEVTVFIGQILPVIRNFISISAGINKIRYWQFISFTFVGASVWSFILALIGYKLGENWESIKIYFQRLDWVVIILIILALGFWIYRHVVKR